MNLKTLLLAFSFCLLWQSVRAQVSPGDLALPHAQLEGIKNCTQCHSLGGKADVEKCLQCHIEIKVTLKQKRGYHFFLREQNHKACFECHSDHNGREFEMIFWPGGQENFNHNQAGYALEGKHYFKVKCEDCHQPQNFVFDLRKLNKKIDLGKTFLGLSQKCLSCHDDEHRGQLSKDCLRCHNYLGWKPASKFDHNKAKFRLTGKHNNLECAKCHTRTLIRDARLNKKGRYSFIKFVDLTFNNCTSCHRDVHMGKLGQNCKKCHSTTGWLKISSGRFDHSLTRFSLVGLHKQVTCEKCHGMKNRKRAMSFAKCSDCHKDEHLGQFADRTDAGRCESCHDVFGFESAKYGVKEHQTSAYPLTGAHLAVTCVSCHVKAEQGPLRGRRIFEFATTTCNSCHLDVHKGQFAVQIQLGGCESCHQTSDWEETVFAHDRTRFPLVGKHQKVECGKCHKTVDAGTPKERVLFRPMKMSCSDCHKDIHFGQFSKNFVPKTCEHCHTAFGWTELIFNHTTDSIFRLKGAHENVPCEKCHKLVTKRTIEFVLYKPMDKRCVSCHG